MSDPLVRNCGHCHTCNGSLVPQNDGEYCGNCRALRYYFAHEVEIGDVSECSAVSSFQKNGPHIARELCLMGHKAEWLAPNPIYNGEILVEMGAGQAEIRQGYGMKLMLAWWPSKDPDDGPQYFDSLTSMDSSAHTIIMSIDRALRRREPALALSGGKATA